MHKVTRFFSPISALAFALPMAAWVSGCTPGFEGEYSDPAKTEILDDKWNDSDARKTAQTLVESALGQPWITEYQKANKGERPVVIVDDIENRTDEHIDTKALTEAVQNALVASRKVRFVNAESRQKILNEIKYQQSGVVDSKSAKNTGKQIGADFMMGGAISSIVSAQDKVKSVTYQTKLQMTDIETTEIVWNEIHPIKKTFRRSGASW
jgi:uncharacterized protein (TIGR02722 family)